MRTIFCLVFLLASVCIQAQDSSLSGSEMPRALIKISPFQFFVQTFELSLETMDKNYQKAFQISAGYKSGQNDFSDGKGGTVTLAYRKYARAMNTVLVKNPDVKQGIYYS